MVWLVLNFIYEWSRRYVLFCACLTYFYSTFAVAQWPSCVLLFLTLWTAVRIIYIKIQFTFSGHNAIMLENISKSYGTVTLQQIFRVTTGQRKRL